MTPAKMTVVCRLSSRYFSGKQIWYVRKNSVSAQVESQNKSKGTCFKICRRGYAAQAAFMVSVRGNFVSTQVESQNKSKGTCFKIRRRGYAVTGRFCGKRAQKPCFHASRISKQIQGDLFQDSQAGFMRPQAAFMVSVRRNFLMYKI